jgi:hypothetical protein
MYISVSSIKGQHLYRRRIHIYRPSDDAFVCRIIFKGVQQGVPLGQVVLQGGARGAFKQHLRPLYIGHALNGQGHCGKAADVFCRGQLGCRKPGRI